MHNSSNIMGLTAVLWLRCVFNNRYTCTVYMYARAWGALLWSIPQFLAGVEEIWFGFTVTMVIFRTPWLHFLLKARSRNIFYTSGTLRHEALQAFGVCLLVWYGVTRWAATCGCLPLSDSVIFGSHASKGPSQKYLEANEVKYFSLGGWGGGVGDFMVTISLFQKKIGLHLTGLVFTIIEWSQK